jgi:hypothetical protein
MSNNKQQLLLTVEFLALLVKSQCVKKPAPAESIPFFSSYKTKNIENSDQTHENFWF